MKICVLNGSPRKNWNTGKMCESFADGAKNAGADVEVIHLHDLNYKGCHGCFLCKQKGGKFFGKCGYKDEICNLLEEVSHSDGVVFASPIYFGDVTAQLKGFCERLFFPFGLYDANYTKIAPKRFETAVMYTMNVKEEIMSENYFDPSGKTPLGFFEQWIELIFTKPERVCAFNTYQFTDYSKYVADGWDEKEKAEHRETQFPKDLQNAYSAGVRMVEKIKAKG